MITSLLQYSSASANAFRASVQHTTPTSTMHPIAKALTAKPSSSDVVPRHTMSLVYGVCVTCISEEVKCWPDPHLLKSIHSSVHPFFFLFD
mmetsp:Transcript_31767/g.51263  ORF Transcript_31767/g.51263 Transcript_31767/m.51263 type:complete len:91 (+) Transcript_31767:204-476(+)